MFYVSIYGFTCIRPFSFVNYVFLFICYICTAPGDQSRHLFDYILAKRRFRNSVKTLQTLPRADIDSDHNILVAKICTRLKKIIRLQKGKSHCEFEKFILKKKSAG
jgi:hypothetical protein